MKNLLYLFLIFGSLQLYASDSAENDWKMALKLFQEAESKVRKGANDEAVVLLKTCVEKLKELRYDHPNWNASVVRNRQKAAENRIDDVEELILTSINSLSRNQLIAKLKETQIAKAKFSKAMMIIYSDLKDAKQSLKMKEKDLAEARSAAGGKMVSQSRLDKLTFENLKLKKSLQEKDAKIAHLDKSLKSANQENGTEAITKNLEQQYAKMQKREKDLLKEKAAYINDKQKLMGQFKTLSIKYNDLLEEAKNSDKKSLQKAAELQTLKKALSKELNLRKQAEILAEASEGKLKLAARRISNYEKSEKSLMQNLENLKANSVNSQDLVKANQKISTLSKENTRLKQVEIDLNARNKNLKAESEKNKSLLNGYLNDPARATNSKLQNEVKALKSSILKEQRATAQANSNAISLKSEIAVLTAQLKLQKSIITDLKKKPKVEVVKPDMELSKAYEKNEAELKDRLKLAEDKIFKLERQNKALKEENIAGDEEMIKKYIQARDELKAYKKKFLNLNPQTKEQQGILENVMTDEQRKEKDRSDKLRELLYQAQKAEKESQFQAAIGLYSEVLNMDRKNFDALLRIGLIHYNRRHFHDAKVHLKKAFYMNPDDPQLLLALGIAELEQDNLDLAVSALSRLVGMNPKNTLARVQLGVSLHGLGWSKAAMGQLKKACELDQKNPEAAFNLALVYLDLPQPQIKEAEEYYEKAVKLGLIRDPELDKFFKQHKK